MNTGDIIRSKLQSALSVEHLEIEDESSLHAGHAAAGGGGHYAVTVVAPEFEGQSSLGRHRLIYRVLAGEMKTSIHALALATYTPAEWAALPNGTRRVSTLR